MSVTTFETLFYSTRLTTKTPLCLQDTCHGALRALPLSLWAWPRGLLGTMGPGKCDASRGLRSVCELRVVLFLLLETYYLTIWTSSERPAGWRETTWTGDERCSQAVQDQQSTRWPGADCRYTSKPDRDPLSLAKLAEPLGWAGTNRQLTES